MSVSSGASIDSARTRARRDRLLALKEDLGWSKRDRIWVEDLANFYGVDTELRAEHLVEELLVHVDTIPKSLALAQAAKESAWATSRFASEGNLDASKRMLDELRNHFESVCSCLESYLSENTA